MITVSRKCETPFILCFDSPIQVPSRQQHKPSSWPDTSKALHSKPRTYPSTFLQVFLKLLPPLTGRARRAWPVGLTAEPARWTPRPKISLRSQRNLTCPQLSTRFPPGVALAPLRPSLHLLLFPQNPPD